MLMRLVSWVFEGIIEIFLWLAVIGCAIAGIFIGDTIGVDGLWGFILGAVVGVIFDVVFGGLLATVAKTGRFVSELRNGMQLPEDISGEISELKKEISELRKGIKKMSSGSIANNNMHSTADTPVAANPSADNDNAIEDVDVNFCPSCGKQIDASSTDVRIYKTCNHCHSHL